MRKFFGSLVPGFAWVLLLSVFLHGDITSLELLSSDPAVRYATVILTSYVLGIVNIHLSFNILALFGDGVDLFMSRLGRTRARPILRFFSERLHCLDLVTLVEERRQRLPRDANKPPGTHGWYKLLLLARSPELAKEAFDKEGDMNFYAGMFPPVLALGFWLIGQELTLVGILALLVALIFALRFQHLRHDEVVFLAQAYQALLDREAGPGGAEGHDRRSPSE